MLQLWKGSAVSKFQLSDPYGHEVRFDYEPAHDSHLHAWLRQPDTLSTLRTQGLVTPKLRVSCSVQQYNNYRQFLRNLYRDALRHEADLRVSHYELISPSTIPLALVYLDWSS